MAERREEYPKITEQLQVHSDILIRIDERQKYACEHLQKINGSIEKLWEGLSETNKRVSALERWRSYLVGIWTATITGIGLWAGWGNNNK